MIAHAADLRVEGLTVERRHDPLGIDAREPRFAWRLSGASGPQSAYQLEVSDTVNGNVTWDSGLVAHDDSTYVTYSGPPLRSRRRYSWRIRARTADRLESPWSTPGFFEMGLLAPEDWTARWIAHVVPDLVSEPEELRRQRPSPLLRRRFSLSGAPRRARLYITALGVYEAYLNGTRVGDERLAPGWTDYNVRIQYQTYDVTRLLQAGDNVLAVALGDGWYTGTVGPWGRYRYGDAPAVLCQLECERAGEVQTVASDDGWRACGSGTWLNDLQLGERTDLRKDPHGWNSVGFDDDGWDAVSFRGAPGSRLVATRDGGIQVVETLPAVAVHAPAADRSIIDLGANAAGVVRLRTDGMSGQHVVIRHAEALDANGELYTVNLRGAEQQDEFILDATGPVSLEPRFTFHGFRYADVSGVAAPVNAADIELRVLSSANRLVGTFACSDPLVDKLQGNIVTSLRANFLSIPTDCPQRNERLGWTADLQIFAPTALFNADVTNMIDKWLDDLVDTQLPSGAYADIAPAPSGWAGAGNTAWSDAGVIVPWVLYERSGDAGVLDRLYDSMRRYMAFLEADQTNGLRFGGRYGDWVSLGARTDKLFIGSAYLAYVSDLFTRIAALVGKRQDEDHFRSLTTQVRQALQGKFLDGDGRLTVDTQTAYAMALGFELLPESARPAAGERLAELVRAADTHLATGFLGTPLVMPALSDNGHHELACQLLRQDSYPSWLFEVRQGATSIWERWNAWTPEQGFNSSSMNSFNHYAFGAVGDWMYRYLAGLQPVEPGYRRTELRPRPGAGFTAARATHESLYGTHSCGWSIDAGTLRVDAVVPPNTSATVVLAVDGVEGVRLNGQPIQAAHVVAGQVRVDVSPGQHTLEAPYRCTVSTHPTNVKGS